MSLPPDPADRASAAPSTSDASADALEPTLDAEVLPLEDLGPLAHEHAGRYHLERVVGRGGQSVVHAARDTWLGRVVAYKQRLPGTAGEARFVREARLTAVLDHPGIVTVHELGRRPDGSLYATQALVRGETLGARLARAETLPERLALLRNLVDACFAVGFAHGHGVVHRDLKPDNIMVGAFGETVVLDWGIAGVRGQPDAPGGAHRPRGPDSLTHDGAVMGTPGYMAPEQARGDLEAIGPASDVWSLGAILYELVTGTPAVTGLDSQQKLAQSADLTLVPVRVVNPDVPPDLAALTERAMAPDPADRFTDAVALAEELERWRAGGRVAGYTYGAQDLVRWAARRHPVVTALSVALLALLVIAAALLGRAWRAAERLEDEVAAETSARLTERARAHVRAQRWGEAAEALARADAAGPSAPAALWAGFAEALAPVGESRPRRPDVELRAASDRLDRCAGLDGRGGLVWWACAGDAQATRVGALRARDAAVALSGDGSTVAYADGPDRVRIVTLAGDRPTREVEVPDGPATALALGPAGRYLALGTPHGTARISTAEDTAPRWIVTGGASIRTVAADADGRGLALDADGHVWLVPPDGVSAEAGALLVEGQRVHDAWLAPTGGEVWLAQLDGTLRRVDLVSGRTTALAQLERPVTQVAFAGSFAASADRYGAVQLWHRRTGRRLLQARVHHRVAALALTIDPPAIGAMSGDGALTRLGVAGALHHAPTLVSEAPVRAVAWSPIGRTWAAVDAAGVLAVAQPGLPARRWAVGVGPLVAVAWHPDGQSLAALAEGAVLVQQGTATPHRVFSLGAAGRALAWSSDGQRLLVGLEDGGVQVLDTTTWASVARPTRPGRPVDALAVGGVGGDERIYVAQGDEEIVALHPRTFEARIFRGGPGRSRALTVSPDGQWLAAGGADGAVTLWRVRDGRTFALARSPEPAPRVDALAFAPDGAWLVRAGPGPRLRVWPTPDDDAAPTGLGLDGLSMAEPRALAFAPDGGALAIGDAAGVVTVLPWAPDG